MKIFHLHHSGFLIQFDDKTLVFDCFTPLPEKFLRKGITHYFFVSHAHSDHYNPDIFKTKADYQPCFILSDDIPVPTAVKNYHMVAPYQQLRLNDLEIKTFGSTDCGVSFYLQVNSHLIFHAGDLNWWDWDVREKPHINIKQEELDFKGELEKMRHLPMEIAFVPVDPRLGQSFYKAAAYFIDVFHPKVLIPMHFRDHFEIIHPLKAKIGESKTILPEFSEENVELKIPVA